MIESTTRPTSVADYLAILGRRKWIVLLPPIVAAVLGFYVSATGSAVYRATAQVLVDRTQSVPSSVTGASDVCLGDPNRCLTTLATSAKQVRLAKRVADQLPGMTAGRVLAEISVDPSSDADLLSVSADDPNPATAAQLANTFAKEFSQFTKERLTGQIDRALSTLQVRLKSLIARGQVGTAEYQLLAQQQTQLVLARELTGNLTSVNELAGGASKIRPTPKRNAVLAGLLGLVLGLALALLAEALDRHVRSEHELEQALELPLLARLPKPPRKLQKANELVMLREPGSVHAEAYRKFRTSLEFVNPDDAARTIMVTSAIAFEGKSTTIANLAVALARAGHKVVIVDLDLRAPSLSRLFHVGNRPGITDVAMKRHPLDQVLRPVALGALRPSAQDLAHTNGSGPAERSNGAGQVDGLLHVLPAGTLPPSADEMLQDARLTAVLDQLASDFDLVLVDAPPLLAFGDAMILSAHVDAIFAVARLGRVQRPVLHELARQLQNCRAKALGFVVTGVEHSDSYRYMYDGYAYDPRIREREQFAERDPEHV
jgi:Mrp family chromosome partitioning ATPase/capsular polysaccharide biosynthesis protein